MRWLYLSDGDQAAIQNRAEKVRSIDEWWRHFRANESAMRDSSRAVSLHDMAELVRRGLDPVDPRLMWEFNHDGAGVNVLAITPESEKSLRPMVRTLIERAPKMDGWRFVDHRESEPPNRIAACVEARTQSRFQIKGCRATIGECNLINLDYVTNWNANYSQKDALGAAFVTTEVALGEHLLDTWIGSIEASKKLLATNLIPIPGLLSNVKQLIETIRDGLPREPWVDRIRRDGENVQASLFSLGPNELPDCEDRKDLLALTSVYPEMDVAALKAARFCSARFSRFGELFCFLKIDGSNLAGGEKFDDRMTMEQAIDEVLVPPGVGCTLGGGTGFRYSYITLALMDVERGIELVRERMQRGSVTRRAWIQFFDETLAAEWIGIWDDSPVPPGK